MVREGDSISIDGTSGEVFAGAIPTVEPDYQEETDLITLLSWADKCRRLGVWTNADYPRDAERARKFGAEGIGLCRTEHMFFEEERRPIVVRMVLLSGKANAIENQIEALEKELEKTSGEKAQAVRAKLKELKADPDRKAYFEAMEALLPFQREDFEGIFKAMDGLPVIIRLIDPPMHEFLPPREELIREVTELRCNGSAPRVAAGTRAWAGQSSG